MNRRTSSLLKFYTLMLVLVLFLGYVWPTTAVVQPGGWDIARERLFEFLRKPFETDSSTHATDDLSEKANPKVRNAELEERIRELKDRNDRGSPP